MEIAGSVKINSSTIVVVPRYCETDQGGVVHHSVYPVWLEMGRTELLRANELAYKDLEARGVFFVIAELKIKYRRPAKYDCPVIIVTTCTNVTASKIQHEYVLTDEQTGEILAQAQTVLACVGTDKKIRRIPKFMYPAQN